MERMEWIEDLDGRVFYAQGIVSVDANPDISNGSSRKERALEPTGSSLFPRIPGGSPRRLAFDASNTLYGIAGQPREPRAVSLTGG